MEAATQARIEPPPLSPGSSNDGRPSPSNTPGTTSTSAGPRSVVSATPASAAQAPPGAGTVESWLRKRGRRGATCVPCKKAKTKCRPSSVPEEPCQRCKAQGYDCLTQVRQGNRGWGAPGEPPTRRRRADDEARYNRRDTDEARRRKQSGHTAPSGAHIASTQASYISFTHPPVPVHPTSSSSTLRQPPGGSPGPGLRPVPQPSLSRAWESTVFNGPEIEAYFQTYIDFFHPHFPILPSTILQDPNRCYETSEILFWTIVLIACRHDDKDRGRLNFLADTVPPELWSSLSTPPLSLASVNTLILLCAWPLPTIRFMTDPSPVFTGMAMNSCLLLGLHTGRAGHRDFFLMPNTASFTDEEAALTWAGYNIVSQQVSTYMGLPSTTLFTHQVDALLSPHEVSSFEFPKQFICILDCSRLLSRVSKAMTAQVSAFSGVSHATIAEYEEEFSLLEARHTSDSSSSAEDTIIQLTLRHTLLEIQSYYFLPPPTSASTTSTSLSLHTQERILRAYHTSRRLLTGSITTDSRSRTLSEGSFPLRTFPHWRFRSILLAACIVFKVIQSASLTANVRLSLNTDAQKRSVASQCIEALKACSIRPGDLPERASGLFQAYWEFTRKMARGGNPVGGDAELCLEFTQRLGASVTFDCVKRWKEHAPIPKKPATSSTGALGLASKELGADPSTATSTDTMTGNSPGGLDFDMAAIDWGSFLEDFDWNFNTGF
ncbi:uncharacterized protein MKZ38_005857 [Zalerion maritima]|uniref:Zn(2)-C6 fungal-type domain-containing protein n=1 Tax=Zalerion maritima TaxID=339359 RepID=A0AAD5RJX6_9PEZI|nr:uncharacterized protein MKZ38_005857 [Zalerion maritima]